MYFYKYHALGNDYLVIPRFGEAGSAPDPALIRRICHRNYGIGSDGILLPVHPPPGSARGIHGLAIFNPDGSLAEKSGNGLRIFARWLFDQHLVGEDPFPIWTPGGWVQARIFPGGSPITIEMGQASFDSSSIPVLGPPRQVIDEPLGLTGENLRICALTLGNPHCVVLNAPCDEPTARRLGPQIENHFLFPQRTNVQFLQVLDRANIAIQIWERGAGYTLASGSSSCAAAAAAHQLGLVDNQVSVHCPGGELQVAISSDIYITLTGPVEPVAEGEIY
jgi:diaminopimelate epimerase